MPTVVTVTSQFKGVDKPEIFLGIMKSADTIAKNLITENYGVVNELYLPSLKSSISFKAGTDCAWNPSGTLTLVDNVLTVKRLISQNEVCKSKFVKTFQAQHAGLVSAHHDAIPQNIQEAFLLTVANAVAGEIDNMIWNGNGGTDTISGGLAQLTNEIKIYGDAITTANVDDQLYKVYEEFVDLGLQDEEDAVLVVSQDVASKYKMNLAQQGQNTTNFDKELDFLGVRMEIIKKLPANTILAYRVKNFNLGSGLGTDLEEIKIYDNPEDLTDIIKYMVAIYLGVKWIDQSEVIRYVVGVDPDEGDEGDDEIDG